jgi:hypothetical protein
MTLGTHINQLARAVAAVSISKSLPDPLGTIAAMKVLAENVAYILSFEDVVLLMERPTRHVFEACGDLHCEDGPALEFAGGVSYHYFHGIRVPSDYINWSGTAHDIVAESDWTRRAIRIDRYGLDGFLKDMCYQTHKDDTGVLWKIKSLQDLDWAVLECWNGTVEPSGERRRFVLQVPGAMETAKQAVAWTYGLGEHDYKLAVRT